MAQAADISKRGRGSNRGERRGSYLFASESVSEGHPDKLCDKVSDAIVDLFLGVDGEARVACETLATTDRLIVAGEVSNIPSLTPADIEETARRVVRDIGYEQEGFHWRTLVFENYLHEQSPDIALGVDGTAPGVGAGDQGMMFGYACRETAEFMPAPLVYAHRIVRLLAESRHQGRAPLLGPDAKSQVAVVYRDGKPVGVDSVVVSTQHDASASRKDVCDIVRRHVAEALPGGWMCGDDKLYVNPTGRFVVGGPKGDTGLTGRKIIVDTYGGAAPHGGGAFSGKDPTKVDRSAAYAARYLAKNVVAAGLAERCTIQISYAIGVAHPLSLNVDTHGNGCAEGEALADALRGMVDLSPRGIREAFQLQRPVYERTAAYGHFGRTPHEDGGFSWERTDLADALAAAFKR